MNLMDILCPDGNDDEAETMENEAPHPALLNDLVIINMSLRLQFAVKWVLIVCIVSFIFCVGSTALGLVFVCEGPASMQTCL